MDFKTIIFNRIFNMNKRKLGVIFILALVSILILFPFIDTNFFYANRIKNRINILQEITKLDMDKINQDENLLKEYNSIINEINESDNNYINKVLNNNKNEHFVGKFISGGILWWILGLFMLFFYNIFNKEQTERKNWGTRIAGFILCIFIGAFIGLICSIIPIIYNKWVNYTIVPIIVLILMILLLCKTTYKNN